MSERILPVSVHVLTKNSAATLEACLRSVEGCEEILVLDGGSTDKTMEIAKRFGAHVMQQPATALKGGVIKDFAHVRNAALKTSSQQWILILDSDEEASPELMNAVRGVTQREGGPSAYRVPRRYRLPDGRLVTHATTYPNERIYFFKHDAVEGWEKPVHERPKLREGVTTGRLDGWMIAPLGTVEEYKRKNRVYLKLEAERARGQGWGAWLARVLRALRSRLIALIKLAWIWLIPHGGVRLPLRHELARFWYAWRVIVETRPGYSR